MSYFAFLCNIDLNPAGVHASLQFTGNMQAST